MQELDLTGSSRLSKINADAFGYKSDEDSAPKALKKLKLEKCNLTSLSADLLPWTNVESLALGSNPLDCGSELQWLIEDRQVQNFVGETQAK